MNNEEKLKIAFRKSLRLSSDAPIESLEYARSVGWDSFNHINLLEEIEEAFGVAINIQDALTIRSYSLAKQVLEKYKVSFSH